MAKSRFDLKFVIIIAIIPIINGVPLDLKSIGSNWTTEDVENFKQNAITNLKQLAVFNCTMIFFPIEETIQSLKECSNSLTTGGHGHRRKRDVISEIEAFLGYHPEPIHFFTSTRNRRVRGVPKILTKGVHDESEDPCIGHCVLQKLGMVDAQGTPDKEVLTQKITNFLTHTKGYDAKVGDVPGQAEAIVTSCMTQRKKQLEKLYDGGGNIEVSKCSAATKLGGCLSKDTLKACIARNSGTPGTTK